MRLILTFVFSALLLPFVLLLAIVDWLLGRDTLAASIAVYLTCWALSGCERARFRSSRC